MTVSRRKTLLWSDFLPYRVSYTFVMVIDYAKHMSMHMCVFLNALIPDYSLITKRNTSSRTVEMMEPLWNQQYFRQGYIRSWIQLRSTILSALLCSVTSNGFVPLPRLFGRKWMSQTWLGSELASPICRCEPVNIAPTAHQ